jgi:hypothetical protein
MTGLALAAATAMAAAIIILPGLGLAAILGLRGLWAWGLAGPFGVTVIVLSSLVAPGVGLAWGPLPVVAMFAAIAIGIAVARALLGGFRRPPVRSVQGGRRWAPVAALGLAAVLLGAQLVQVIQAPGNISQTFDNIFHLNAIRFALDTANASPLHLGSMTSKSGGVWFYPSAWHAVGSLVVQMSGVDIAVATNSVAFVSACLLWPAGAVLLARTMFGRSSALILVAGVFAAALPSMPLLLLNYGVLYPFELGLSITPAALAAALVLLRIGMDATSRVTWVWTIAVLGTLPALAIAHPGAFMAWLVLVSVAVLTVFVGYLRSAPGRRQVMVASLGFIGYAAVTLIAWRVLRPPADARGWMPTLTLGQGIGEAATLSFWSGAIPIVAVAALAVGLFMSARRRTPVDIWAIGAFTVASLLFIVSIALPWNMLRDLLTASWYNNAPRLAAIVPILVVPLAALGAAAVWDRIRARLTRGAEAGDARRASGLVAVWATSLVVALVVATQIGAVPQAVREASAAYALTADSPLISDDEMALLRRLADEVPEDAVIAGSPWTGTGLAYAISGRHVLMPHTLMDVDEDTSLINDELDEADRRAEVCTAVKNKGVQFVLDFGDREVHGADHPFPGFDRLASSDAVEVVDSEGGAVLYRIIACGVGG